MNSRLKAGAALKRRFPHSLNLVYNDTETLHAGVMKSVDIGDLKSPGLNTRAGSIPAPGTETVIVPIQNRAYNVAYG